MSADESFIFQMGEPGDRLWLGRLAERLRYREAQYRAAKQASSNLDEDPDHVRIEATAAATWSLLEIYGALSSLPEFAGSVGLLPIQDLIGALGDLAKGNKPAMLMPAAGVGLGVDTFNKTYVKKQAVAGTEALKAAGCSMKKACSIVAKVFADAGVKGRKGGRLSAGTVEHWAAVFEGDAAMASQIRDFAASWHVVGRPLPTIAEATEWIRRVAASAAVQSKI